MPLIPHVIDKKISSIPFSGIQEIDENFNSIQELILLFPGELHLRFFIGRKGNVPENIKIK